MKYLTLINEMKRTRIAADAISKFLNLPNDTVTNKLNGGTFNIEEAYRVRDEFFPEWDVGELFQKDE